MSNVVQFKARSNDLDEVLQVLDIAYGKMSDLQAEIDQLEEATQTLQDTYDVELKALAHRLGGMENVPVDYLLYTTLNSEIIEAIDKGLWKEETGNINHETT